MNVLSYLKENILYLDGGMGTLLQAKGLQAGEHPERWNLTHAEDVSAIHRAYYDAGSNVVSANTFGANSLKFSSTELEEIICAAMENVRRARKESCGTQAKFAALDIGPLGKLLKPYGDLDFEDAVSVFAKTVRLGAKYGADLVLIETMNDSYETKAALLAVKENCDLPVFVSNAYGEDGKLMTGADPAAMVAMLEGMGADAIGVNCSLGPEALRGVVEQYLALASVPVLLKPNAGLPVMREGKTCYDVDAAAFAKSVASMVGDGVRLAGGCCGTTPEYIAALVKETAGMEPKALEKKNRTCVSSYTHAVTFGEFPILIGERINPTGKKRFKQALAEHDIGYILNEGIRQQEKGVQILDVNVGLPDIDEASLLCEAVEELQSIIDLPLQIDTADAAAMERAMRRYNGKALVNSVNGKEESMSAIFPLVKKYGGAVIALTLDENGIPETAAGRVAIAEKILARAAEYGIDKKDIIFDTLTMTVSAAPAAAKETLAALRMIREKIGCHTSLGVSNVSFGLPNRGDLNSTFFALALENGLSAAIMNPDAADMLKVWYSYRALKEMDENFVDYIGFAESYASAAPAPIKVTVSAAPAAAKTEEFSSQLQRAVVKGLKDETARLTEEMLQSCEPLTIVQQEIIPALNIVGAGFEKKEMFLPQLLMSAEAASAAFEKVKAAVLARGGASEVKCAVVIATVKGDIHDIGKNIVKLLLENYGFTVIDLGKDVPPETVVEAVVEHHAPIAGLSALMTTTVVSMEETVALLREKAPWCRVMVGGAVMTAEYAQKMGADKYAKDAMEAVRYADEVFAAL